MSLEYSHKMSLALFWKQLKMKQQLISIKYPLKYGRQGNLTTYFYYAILCIDNKAIEKYMKMYIFPISKKGFIGIKKNYRDGTLTASFANALLRSTLSQFLTIPLLPVRIYAKISFVSRFFHGISSHVRSKDGANTSRIYGPFTR